MLNGFRHPAWGLSKRQESWKWAGFRVRVRINNTMTLIVTLTLTVTLILALTLLAKWKAGNMGKGKSGQ